MSEYTDESESKVKVCLSECTLDSYKPLIENTKYIYQNVIGKGKNKKYQDFLFHSIVTSNQSAPESGKTYELSLFGIILALSLIRFYDMDKLKSGLYYSKIPFTKYYDKIASNYRNKLPLIFGKWQILKDILHIFSYYNFDIILDKELRMSNSDNLSVIRGGNKELHDSLKEIVLQTRHQMGQFVDGGVYVWLNYPSEITYRYEGRNKRHKKVSLELYDNAVDRPEPRQVYALMNKIKELTIILNPLEYAFSKSIGSSTEFVMRVSHYLEKLFANEITAFYYFHLFYDYEFHTLFNDRARFYSSISQVQSFSPVSTKPKFCLSLILSKDMKKPMIREWFYGLMQDIVKLQNETYNALKSIV